MTDLALDPEPAQGRVLDAGTFDVVVAGNGPAGGQAARELAAAGLSVALVTRETTIGLPITSTAGTIAETISEFGLPRDAVERDIYGLRLIGPSRRLEIWYDDNDGTSWPMQWYLRDFPNRHLYGGTLAGPPDGVPVVLVGDKNRSSVEPYLEGYTAQEYVLRWWFPEDPVYRDFAIAPEIAPGASADNQTTATLPPPFARGWRAAKRAATRSDSTAITLR